MEITPDGCEQKEVSGPVPRKFSVRRWLWLSILVIVLVTMTLSVLSKATLYPDDFLLVPTQEPPGRPVVPTDGNCEGSSKNRYCLRAPLATILAPSDCNPVRLLLMTISMPESHDRRNLHRKFNAVLRKSGVRRLFLLGKSSSIKQEEIVQEAKEHLDIIQWDMPETYKNIVLKTIMAYKWFNDTCGHVQYYMKTDDDVAINIPALLRFVTERNLKKPFLMGRCVFNRTVKRNRKINRHFIRYEQFSRDHFPPFCEGSGYLMPAKVARGLAQTSFTLPVFPVEDSFTGVALTRLDYLVSIENHPSEFAAKYWFLVASTVCDRLRKGALLTVHCKGGQQLDKAMQCAMNSSTEVFWTQRGEGVVSSNVTQSVSL